MRHRAGNTAYAIADSCPENHLSWTVADSSVASIRLDTGSKWSIRILGKRAGTTNLTLNAWHQAHIHMSSLPTPVIAESRR